MRHAAGWVGDAVGAARRVGHGYLPTVEDSGQTDGRRFELRWTPTVRDFERAVMAKRRATRVLWLDRGLGGLLAVFCAIRLQQSVSSSLPGFLLGLALATGVWGRVYRRLFVWRHANVFVPTHTVVTSDGLEDTNGLKTVRTAWEGWAVHVPLDDMLVLLTSAKGDAGMGLLPMRGLSDSGDWPDLVALVTEHVPLHPKLMKQR